MRNNDVRMNEFPLFSFPFRMIVFISWCSFFIKIFIIMLLRDGINQILFGININPMIFLFHFNGRLLISAVGSKIENMLLIIFSIFC